MSKRTGTPFDRDMATVLRRPGPAVGSLIAGIVIGLTGGAALAGGGDEPPATPVPVASAPSEEQPEATPSATEAPEMKPAPEKKKTKPKAQAGIAGAIAAVDDFVGGRNIGVAILPLGAGKPETAGLTRDFVGWSTLKVPVIAAFLQNSQPTSADLAAIERSIVQSDNEAVRSLYKKLLGDPPDVPGAEQKLQATLRLGGAQVEGMPQQTDPTIDNSVAFGTASWNAAEAAMFFHALACGRVLDDASLMLGHMKNVQGQGAFGAVDVFANVASKGGWNGDVVNQIAIVGGDEDGFVLAVMTESTDFSTGAGLVRQVAQRVKASLGDPGGDPAAPSGC